MRSSSITRILIIAQPITGDVGGEENYGILPELRGGRGCRPKERVHECVALKILQILDRLSDSDQPDRQLEFLGDRDDDPSASGAVKLRQHQTGDADRLMKLTSLGERALADPGAQQHEEPMR